MIPGAELHYFDIHNDGYFSHLPLAYVNGVILEMAVRRMPYEQFTEFLEEKSSNYFQETFGRLNLYLDQLNMNLLEYLSQAVTYEMDACVSKTIGPHKKRYCNDFSMDEMGVETSTSNTYKGIDATEGVKARTSTTYKGKEKVNQDETEVVEARKSTVESDYESEYNSDDDSDYQSYKGETFEEYDIYMNELLKSLKTVDKDGITKYPFIYVEKHVKTNLMYDETTHLRLRKPKVGEKYRSCEARVVAKCGQRPSRLSDPEKGKQRKQTRYPSASSDELPTCPGDYKKIAGEHYAMPRSYKKTILDSNPGSTLKLGMTVKPDDKTYFDSPNQGEILTTIRRDGNNHIFPVVNVENKENWTWFLELLEEDLGCSRGNMLTLMFDQHKWKWNLEYVHTSKKIGMDEGNNKEYEKTVGEHYAMMRSYGKANLDSNPGSIVKLGVTINPDEKTYFDRFYVCFVGMADGWKAWCRKIIALDGLVNVENKDNWAWFLELLVEYMGSSRGNGLTLMSGQHKGLMEAVKDFMPNAEHMQCAIHIYENFRKQYHGFWLVIPAGENLFEVRSWSEGFTVNEEKRTYSYKMWQLSGIPCVHAIKVIFLINRVPESYVPAWFETDMYFVTYHDFVKLVPSVNFWPDQSMYSTGVDVVLKGPVRDEGAGGFKGGASVSRGKVGVGGSRGGASRFICVTSDSRGGADGSRGGDGGSRGGASRSKRKLVSSARTQKRQGKKMVGTSRFAKWFRLQDEPEQTQDKPQQTQHEPDQVQPQEQSQQAALKRPSARILQRKLEKQDISQNTALNVKETVSSSCTGRFHCGNGTAKNQAIVLVGSVPLHWPVPLIGRLILNLNGTLSIAFIIRSIEITLRIEKFARILRIPCRGVCVFTLEWAITSLPHGIDSNPDIYPPPLKDPLLIRDILFDPRHPGKTHKEIRTTPMPVSATCSTVLPLESTSILPTTSSIEWVIPFRGAYHSSYCSFLNSFGILDNPIQGEHSSRGSIGFDSL
ncbi:multidrug resistance-associated protein 5 [Tanacetum coccineum]